MYSQAHQLLLAGSILLLLAPPLLADDLPAAAVPATSLEDSLRNLAQQLDADSFGERQQATQMLRDQGSRAMPILIDAAQRGSAEARSRALEILQSHLESSDESLKQAAREALESISKSDGPASRLAHQILNPPPPPTWNELRARQMQLRVPPVAIMRNALPAAVRRYSITVNENGRVIRLSGSEKGIDIEITETDENGRKVTEKFHGKDAAELKEKHPEAHKIFEDFSRRFGIRQPDAPAEQPQQGAAPQQEAPPQQIQPPGAAQRPVDVIEQSQHHLRQRIEEMRRQLGQQPNDHRAQMIELMERHLQRLEDAKKHFQQP